MRGGAKVRAHNELRDRAGLGLRSEAILAPQLPPWRAVGQAVLLAGLAVWLLAGCSSAPLPQLRQEVSCSQLRLDAAQRLYLAARANMARHYKERSALTLNAAYYFAGDAIQVARATRTCPDFDARVRTAAVNVVRMGRQLRILAFSTMRDSDPEIAQSLLGELYSDAFAGRDLD